MKTPMLRIVLLGAAFASTFFYPYPLTLALSFAASIVFPPSGLFVGMFSDFLYYTAPELPLATLIGAGVSLLGYVVRRFVKARIMTA